MAVEPQVEHVQAGVEGRRDVVPLAVVDAVVDQIVGDRHVLSAGPYGGQQLVAADQQRVRHLATGGAVALAQDLAPVVAPAGRVLVLEPRLDGPVGGEVQVRATGHLDEAGAAIEGQAGLAGSRGPERQRLGEAGKGAEHKRLESAAAGRRLRGARLAVRYAGLVGAGRRAGHRWRSGADDRCHVVGRTDAGGDRHDRVGGQVQRAEAAEAAHRQDVAAAIGGHAVWIELAVAWTLTNWSAGALSSPRSNSQMPTQPPANSQLVVASMVSPSAMLAPGVGTDRTIWASCGSSSKTEP